MEIGSRNERPMTRYFPEVVEAVKQSLPERCVVDGEIVVVVGDRLEFEVLQQRIHPAASRVRLLSQETPASFIAFDLLAAGRHRLDGRPFERRRAALEEALAAAQPPVHLTPVTRDHGLAEEWFSQFEGAGLDGVVAKPLPGTTSRTSGSCSRSSISGPRTAWSPATGYTRAARTASARCSSASTTTPASSPRSGSSGPSPRPGARSCSPSCSRW